MIDFKVLEKLIELLHTTDAHTIEITKRPWSTSIRVSKAGDSGSGPVTYQVAASTGSSPPAPAGDTPGGTDGVPPPSTLIEIKSPMVGTFYGQPEPGAEPYVAVGNRVSVGQTLCIIEAMKIMNPLDSEVSGVIKERRVEDSQPVEFGQVLFLVDPHG
jgi:acetyl-CoA carboxylase biotin carboxyl carrier protein